MTYLQECSTLRLSVCVLSRFSYILLFSTPWTVARQVPLSIGFSRQEYGSGLPLSPPGDLPDPGTEPTSLISPALAGRFFTTSATWEAPRLSGNVLISKLTNRMSEVQSTSACEQAGLTPHWEKMAPSTVALQPSSRDANRNGDSISMGHVSSQNRAHSCIYASGSTAASHTEGLQQMCSAPWTD